MGPFLLQACAGFASAVLLLGTVMVLVGMFTQPEAAQAAKTSRWAWPLRRDFCTFLRRSSNDQIRAAPGPVVVEAYINDQGEVYDYRIVSGPGMTTPVRRLRICCYSATLSRHASSASPCAAWRCCHSPAFRCEDREVKRHERPLPADKGLSFWEFAPSKPNIYMNCGAALKSVDFSKVLFDRSARLLDSQPSFPPSFFSLPPYRPAGWGSEFQQQFRGKPAEFVFPAGSGKGAFADRSGGADHLADQFGAGIHHGGGAECLRLRRGP